MSTDGHGSTEDAVVALEAATGAPTGDILALFSGDGNYDLLRMLVD